MRMAVPHPKNQKQEIIVLCFIRQQQVKTVIVIIA
jgi:hypothetical protein